MVGLGAVGALEVEKKKKNAGSACRDSPSAPTAAAAANCTYQTDQLDAASSELGFELGESTQLGGANGGEVILLSAFVHHLTGATMKKSRLC